jgi:hypothetical protein
LGLVAATAQGSECLDEAIRAITWEHGLQYLFRIAMQCQVIDDVLDYAYDRSAGLPSFLNTGEALPQALARTCRAATSYADTRNLPRAADGPWRLALRAVSICARLALSLRSGHSTDWFRKPHRPSRPEG